MKDAPVGFVNNREYKKRMGERVRFMRETRGYTREMLAEMTDRSPRFIANIEFGDASVSIETLVSICLALDCSADFILFGDGEIVGQTIERRVAQMNYQEIRELVEKLVRVLLTGQSGR